MEGKEGYKKYQDMSEAYKDLVETITSKDLPQIKLYCKNLTKKISSKQKVYEDFTDPKAFLDHFKEAKGKVALHYACARGDVSIVSYLIETMKLDYQVKDKEGNTPFFTAVEHGFLDLVKYFVDEMKISPLSVKEGDICALHLAANNNNIEMMDYFLSKGCDIEKMSIYGKPINWAVGSRHIEATQYLLEKGADPNGDETCPAPPPLILAIDFGCKQIYKALAEAKKLNINAADQQGFTALHIAAQKGDIQIVKDLIEKGSQVNVQAQGKTPLHAAFQNSKMEIVAYLRDLTKNSEKIEKQIEEQKANLKPVDKEKAEEIKGEGNKIYAEKKYEEALQKYKQALSYDPTNEIVHRNMAACYLPLKKYQQALEHCHKAKLISPKNVKTLYREAQAYIGLNNLLEASTCLWECVMLEPQTPYFQQQFKKYVDLAKKKNMA